MPNPHLDAHRITLQVAMAMTKRYRGKAGHGAVRSFWFPREVFEALLAQPNCEGIRLYCGQTTMDNADLVLVGTDARGADFTSGEVMDKSLPCPPFCPSAPSALDG